MRKLLLGIDAGTSSVKVCLYRKDCSLVASAKRAYPTCHPHPLYAEQDADQWWEAAVGAIREALGKAVGEGRVAGIAVSSQSPTMLPVDRDGRPLRKAMIWMDRRAAEECSYLAHQCVGLERYRKILGADPDPYYVQAKLFWYREHEPELYAKTYQILQTNGYLNFKLTGVFSIDMIHAVSVQGMDIQTFTWSPEIETATGLPFQRLFPPISRCDEIIGTVHAAAAQETGLPEGCPVIAGATDAIAAFLGFGIYQEGKAATMIGTSTINFFPRKERVTDYGKLLLKPSPVENVGSLLVAPASTTGASIRWFADTFCEDEQREAKKHGCSVFQIMDCRAEAAAPGSGGLIYLPYLSGERGPLWNSYARGMFIGLSLRSNKADMIRSVLEGTSFAVRHIMEENLRLGGRIDAVRVAGGGSESKIWMKIQSAVLNRPVEILDSRGVDQATLGDALLAGKAIGMIENMEEAAQRCIRVKAVIEPEDSWVQVYRELYPYYIDFYRRLDSGLMAFEQTVKKFTDYMEETI